MMRRTKTYLLALAASVAGIIFTASVFAAQIDRGSYGTIHEDSSSTNYQINGQFADPAVGRVTSSNYILEHYYTLGTTTPFNHCTNNILDFDEVQVDCGGAMCQSCTFHCSNSVQDYDETGVDCGGAFCSSCGGGGGGGGGGGVTYGNIVFSGATSPGASVTLLKDGQIASQIFANSSGNFSITLYSLSAGTYAFLLSAKDTDNLSTGALSYSSNLPSGGNLAYTAILMPPTIRGDKSEVKQGEPINFTGSGAPAATITVTLTNNSTGVQYPYTVTTGANGKYTLPINTASLPYGDYSVKVKAQSGAVISNINTGPDFKIGEKTIEKPPEKTCPQKGDLNGDCRVNLVDFSIAAYWYKRKISADFSTLEYSQLSGDNAINLVDFSILAYYWTG